MLEIAFDTLIGTTLGNYRLIRLIEHSQSGPIFLASTESGAETYLLRFLAGLGNAKKHWHNHNLERFQHLARQLVTLQHPHILPLLDYGIYQDIPYMVTPNLAIRSLRSRLANNGPINVFTVGRYLDQISAALEYAHQQGVLHGNLTLDTIFIRFNGQIVVADFGVRGLLELNAPEELFSLGNMKYAPEQLNDGPIGPYTDVYALGSVLYQLLTGSLEFAGDTADEVAHQQLFAAIQPSRQSHRELPAGLYRIINRALARDPKQRYQQAGALANAYHQVVDPNDRNRAPFVIISFPVMQAQQPVISETEQAESQITEHERSSNGSAVLDLENGSQSQESQTHFLPPVEEDLSEEDLSDSPTLKRVAVLLKQTPFPTTLEEDLSDSPKDLLDDPTPKKVHALLVQTLLPTTLEDLSDDPKPKKVPALVLQTLLPTTLEEDVFGADSLDQSINSHVVLPPQFQRKHTSRIGVIALLLLFIMSGITGMVLISKQNAALSGLVKQVMFLNSSELLLGLCIALAVGFTVSFNIISRMSLATTRNEYAYTILWQLFCALLAPIFLLFDRFTISFNPQVLPLFALSIVLWALVDAFLFSAFKYEEASVLSAIFPLNFLFTFVVSVVLFHSLINSTVVIGFLIIMFASLLVGLYRTRFRPSKGIIFGLLYSFFLGVALGLNSEVVKSFSIAPYMFAAFLFPAVTNLFVFLRPKRAELRYELKVQWKKILLNAGVMDASFFFLLKAFQLGNVPQVVALTASSTLITALAGVVVLREDKHTTLKIIAAVLATVGLILVQR
jgi:eukaryotic-like serine/threonine-protein kinase